MSGPAEDKRYEDGGKPVTRAASGIRPSVAPDQGVTTPPPADYDAVKFFGNSSDPDDIARQEGSRLNALMMAYLDDEHSVDPEVHTFSVEILVSRDRDISDFLDFCTLVEVDLRPFFIKAQAFFDEKKMDRKTGISVLYHFLGEFIETFLGVVTNSESEVDGSLQFSFSSAFANVKMPPVDNLKSFDQKFRKLRSDIPVDHFRACLDFVRTL